MHAVLALSAVVQKPIQMRWPDDGDPRTSTCIHQTRDWSRRADGTCHQHPVDVCFRAEYETRMLYTCWSLCSFDCTYVAVSGSCLGDTRVDSESQGQGVIVPPTTVSDDDELDSVVLPPAGDGNPLNKRFMPLTTCLQILRDNSATLDSVPTGVKDNVWFKVKPKQLSRTYFILLLPLLSADVNESSKQ